MKGFKGTYFSKIISYILAILAGLNYKLDCLSGDGKLTCAFGFVLLPWAILDILAIISSKPMFTGFGMLWVGVVVLVRIWYVHGKLRYHIRTNTERCAER